MAPSPPRFVLRAPDHLGDGVMALPAIEALAAVAPVEVYAPRWAGELYAGFPVRPVDAVPTGGTGVLLKPSFGAAWRWRHLPERVGLATDHRGWLLTQAVPVRPPGHPGEGAEHRRDGYTRVVQILGARVTGPPRFRARGRAPEGLPPHHVGLNPWSPSLTVRWPGYPALAAELGRLGHPVVWYAGPGEGDAVGALAGPGATVVAGLSLPDFAAALDRCGVFVSNDSGAAHFAAACGAQVVMVHGSTAPARTGVGHPVEGPPLWCRPCYRKWCYNGLKCLQTVDPSTVRGVVERVIAGGAR